MFGSNELKITVNVKELIDRLVDNQNKHYLHYTEAIKAWRIELERLSKDCNFGGLFAPPKELKKTLNDCPVSHFEDYSRVIDLLSMSKDIVIKIDSQTFNCYCRDEWDWKSNLMSNKFYSMTSKQ